MYLNKRSIACSVCTVDLAFFLRMQCSAKRLIYIICSFRIAVNKEFCIFLAESLSLNFILILKNILERVCHPTFLNKRRVTRPLILQAQVVPCKLYFPVIKIT